MIELDDGGPAFPLGQSMGLSKRDWFATQVLKAIFQSGTADRYADADAISERCYKQADAMLKTRKA